MANDELKHLISIRIDDELHEAIEQISKAESRRYTAETARILLMEAVKARKRKKK